MTTPRLVLLLLVVCGLVLFAVQNPAPTLSIAFLGLRTVALPLGVWLAAAIALGALTTLALTLPLSLRPSPRPGQRRRWKVHPTPHDRAYPQDSANSPNPPAGSASQGDSGRREVRPRAGDRPSPRNPVSPQPDRSRVAAEAADDWQSWEHRSSPSQWDDWGQASADATESGRDRRPRRQRRDTEQATESYQDLASGWDPRLEEEPVIARGGSTVDDTLDEIAMGWEDWEDDTAPSETAYRYRPASQGSVDNVYAPADAADTDWEAGDRTPDDQVYDADYRVIIPPNRDLDDGDESQDAGDRP